MILYPWNSSSFLKSCLSLYKYNPPNKINDLNIWSYTYDCIDISEENPVIKCILLLNLIKKI